MTSGEEGAVSAPALACPFDARLSDYTVLGPIGSGLRGTVYRARSPKGRLVALKVFNRGVGIDREVLRRFSPASEDPIRHPNLVAVEAAGESEGKAFCTMDLLPGDSLDGILGELREGRNVEPHLSPLGAGSDGRPKPGFIRHTVSLLLEVAEGVHLAHRAGVIHGRLGPRNLIFSPSGRLVVTDFGAQLPAGTRGVGNGVSHDLATLPYRSPEEIDPFPEGIDGRNDVYALGAILYEILTRLPPFSGRNPQKLREAISEGRFIPPSAVEPMVSQEAEAVILRAMALDPADRYPSALDLTDDLRRLLRLEATTAQAEILSAEAGRPRVRRPAPSGKAEAISERPPAALLAPVVPPAAETGILILAPVTGPVPPPAKKMHAPEVPHPPPPVATPEPLSARARAREAVPSPKTLPPKPAFRRRGPPLTAGIAMLFILLGTGGWTWLTLHLHDRGARSETRAATLSAGLQHLESALLALSTYDPGAARGEVVEIRRLGIEDPALRRIESSLGESAGDPLIRDLSHPRPEVRQGAISALARGVEAGERPAADLSYVRAALGDGDPAVRQEAIRTLARSTSSAPLLEAFPLGAGFPPLEIDAPTFLSLVEALAGIGDGPAEELLLAWTFEDFARLDDPEDFPALVSLPPNLRVMVPEGTGGFGAAWIRARGKLASGEILTLSERARKGEARLAPLVAEIIDALAVLGGREAAEALASLAAPFHLAHAPRILDALLGLGEAEELIGLARTGLPDSLRVQAVRAAGKAIALTDSAASRARAVKGLSALLRRDPHPQVRRAALHGLMGAGTAPVAFLLEPALFDHALHEEALALLERQTARQTVPILIDLIRRGDSRLRLSAARAITRSGDRSALAPLSLLLHQADGEVRAVALEVMRTLSAPRALILAAGFLPPGDPALLELALDVVRCPLEPDESPGLRLIALRESLGLPDDPPQALGEARRALLREALPGSPRAPIAVPARAASVEGR